MVTYTIGVGGTYTDFNAAMTAASADNAVISGGNQLQDIHFTVTKGGINTSSVQTISGFSSNGFTLYIEPISGQGFRDAWSRGRILYPNPDYGAFFRSSGSNLGLSIAVDNVTIRYMILIKNGDTGGTSTNSFIYYTGHTGGQFLFDSNMLLTDGETDHAPGITALGTTVTDTPTFIEQNSLLVGTTPTLGDFLAVSATSPDGSHPGVIYKGYYNTHVQTNVTVNQGYGIDIDNANSIIENMTVSGFGMGTGGENNGADYASNFIGAISFASHNATSKSAFSHSYFGANSGVVNATTSASFNSFTDFRLKSGSPLIGAGLANANSITVDILGRTRNSTDDIGCWAYSSSQGPITTGGVKTQIILSGDVNAVGLQSWTVPDDWDSTNNMILLIGGGGNNYPVNAESSGGGGGSAGYLARNYIPGSAISFNMSNFGASPTFDGLTAFDGVASPNTPTSSGGAAGTGGDFGYKGGNGNDRDSGYAAGAGGGGAAGAHGAGADGAVNNFTAGGGGGAADGGSVGNQGTVSGTTTVAGGQGGTARDSTAGGVGGTTGSPNGGTGSHGSGGGAANYTASTGVSGAGGSGVDYTATIGAHIGLVAGPGGGGGGASSNGVFGSTGASGAGGAYGGGAGGGNGTVQAGGARLLVIQYGTSSPTIAINTPSTQVAGVSFTISGTYSGTAPSSLNYQVNSGGYTALSGATISGGNWSGTITIATGGSYTVSVQESPSTTVTATSSSFTVSGPSISITTPSGLLVEGQSMTVSGTYTGTAPSGLNYKVDSGSFVAASSPTISGGNWSFSITVPAYGQHTITVQETPTTSLTTTSGNFIVSVAPNNSALVYSLYNWNVQAAASTTINAGAWFKTFFTGTSCVLNFNVANMVTNVSEIGWQIDGHGGFTIIPVASTVTLTLPTDTPSWGPHLLEVFVKATTEFQAPGGQTGQRWNPASSPNTAVILTSITLASGAVISAAPVRTKNVLVFGDSMVEGYCALNATATADVDRSNSQLSWAAFLAQELGVNISQVGFGSQGWLNAGVGSVPAFTSTYNYLYSGTTRSYTTPPDLIVIAMGHYDTTTTTTTQVTTVLNGLLAATTCPIVVVRPLDATYGPDQQPFLIAGIAACNTPSRCTYLSTSGFFSSGNSSDGVNPYGSAAASIASQIAPTLRSLLSPTYTPKFHGGFQRGLLG